MISDLLAEEISKVSGGTRCYCLYYYPTEVIDDWSVRVREFPVIPEGEDSNGWCYNFCCVGNNYDKYLYTSLTLTNDIVKRQARYCTSLFKLVGQLNKRDLQYLGVK